MSLFHPFTNSKHHLPLSPIQLRFPRIPMISKPHPPHSPNNNDHQRHDQRKQRNYLHPCFPVLPPVPRPISVTATAPRFLCHIRRFIILKVELGSERVVLPPNPHSHSRSPSPSRSLHGLFLPFGRPISSLKTGVRTISLSRHQLVEVSADTVFGEMSGGEVDLAGEEKKVKSSFGL